MHVTSGGYWILVLHDDLFFQLLKNQLNIYVIKTDDIKTFYIFDPLPPLVLKATQPPSLKRGLFKLDALVAWMG